MPIVNATKIRTSNVSFDAVLFKDDNDAASCRLTLELRIRLEQINPRGTPVYPDYDGNAFWIRPWSGTEWSNFIRGAKAQADLWNNNQNLRTVTLEGV
jgi:hypothetical protein